MAKITNIFRLLVIGSSLIPFVFCFPEETGCGFPGIPLNGVLTFTISGQVSRYDYSQIALNESIRNGFWPVETLVDYECETEGKFVLTGSRQRICLDDGTWGGQLPFCDENVAYRRKVFVNNMANNKSRDTTLLTDGIVASGTSKGIYLSGKSKERLVLELQSAVYIRSFIIHGNGEENWQENWQNSTVLRNTEEETRCNASATDNNSIQFSCPDDGISSRKITFFHSSKAKCFIVEIQVFVRPKNRCGFPEIPINGRVRLLPDGPSPEAVFYRCSSGFQLTGLKERKCIGRSWSGLPPNCQYLPTTTTSTTSVTYSTLLTQMITPRANFIPAVSGSTSGTQEASWTNDILVHTVVHADHRPEVNMKSSVGSLATGYIILIIVLAVGLTISLSVTIFLYKRRRSKLAQSHSTNAKIPDGYEDPVATSKLLIDLDIIPDQRWDTDEQIFEWVEFRHQSNHRNELAYEEIDHTKM